MISLASAAYADNENPGTCIAPCESTGQTMTGEPAIAPGTQPAVAPPAPGVPPAPGATAMPGAPTAPVAAGQDNTVLATGQLPDIPHLPSPDNLPPGTSGDPIGPQTNPNVSYLKELWHALKNKQITRSDALLALAQRPLNTPVTNSPGMGSVPNPAVPNSPAAPNPGALLPPPAPPVNVLPGQ